MASIDSLKASDGSGNASVATVQNNRSAGATTLIVDTVQGINTNFHGTMGTPHTFTDPVTGETITIISEATAVDFKGHVDGSNLEIDTIAPGFTDGGSEVGDIIIIKPTTQEQNEVAEILEVSHNDDGTLKVADGGDISDENGNEQLGFQTTASAVNNVELTNAATGNAPQVAAVGDDANIDLELKGKGTGIVKLPSTNKTTDANGWTVYDYGGWKEYRKRITFSQTINAGSGSQIVESSTNLPVGVATISDGSFSYSCTITNGNAYATNLVAEMSTAATSLAFTATKVVGSTGTVSGFIDMVILV